MPIFLSNISVNPTDGLQWCEVTVNRYSTTQYLMNVCWVYNAGSQWLWIKKSGCSRSFSSMIIACAMFTSPHLWVKWTHEDKQVINTSQVLFSNLL